MDCAPMRVGLMWARFLKAAQQEAPKAERLFDDAEDRFDGLLAQLVKFPARLGFQPVRHDLARFGCGRGMWTARTMISFSVFVTMASA